jgi:basic amino acid/polyamine antiporter, APA family
MAVVKKKYGLFTAVAMVVGVVIGSGVFFKAGRVLRSVDGNLVNGILAWIVGAAIMLVSAYVFSVFAQRINKVNGVVDFMEAAYGSRVGKLVAWFMSVFYYPTLVAVLAWVSADFTASLLELPGENVWIIGSFYLVLFFVLNLLSPVLAGKFQVSATVIKLIPLVLMAVIGTIVGLVNGVTIENFTTTSVGVDPAMLGGFSGAVLSTAFAYEGWIVATSINAELKNAKRDLPLALVLGTLIVAGVYITYYIGLAGTLPNSVFVFEGNGAVFQAFSSIFGNIGATLLLIFIIISCLGTLNGLVMGATRGIYSIAVREKSKTLEAFEGVDKTTDATVNSGLLGLLLSAVWFVVWYGSFQGWYNGLFMDISELPIATLYGIYIFFYIWIIRTAKDLNILNRFIMPLLALTGAGYMVYSGLQLDLALVFIGLIALTLVIATFLPKMLEAKPKVALKNKK